MARYGKPIADVLDHKGHFWEENDEELRKRKDIADVYTSQPERTHCKICSRDIDDYELSFVKHGVENRMCGDCGHLSGLYEDTQVHPSLVCRHDEEAEYAQEYTREDEESYTERLKSICEPKVEFLFDSLREKHLDPTNSTFVDLGAGSGYMVSALTDAGANEVTGYEVSKKQVDFAGAMRPDIDIRRTDTADIYDIAAETDADVVTLIGVLEHLRRPVELMQAIGSNGSVEYVFTTFP